MTVHALVDAAAIVVCAIGFVGATVYREQLSNFLGGRPIISFNEALRMMEKNNVKSPYLHTERQQESKLLPVDELEERRPFNAHIFSWLMPQGR